MGGNGVGEDCNTGLSLGLGLGLGNNYHKGPNDHNQMVCLDLSFTLSTREQAPAVLDHKANKCLRLKKMEDEGQEDEEEEHHMNKSCNFEENDNVNINGRRKKLRLTKEQSFLLEDTFKLHTNLNPSQKQALAEKLMLMPRQVEVWFQNRRARTKLKQTEMDCESLKKCCARLSDENRRLKRELQELQSLRPAHSLFQLHFQVPKVTTKSHICEQPTTTIEGTSASAAALTVFNKHELQKK